MLAFFTVCSSIQLHVVPDNSLHLRQGLTGLLTARVRHISAILQVIPFHNVSEKYTKVDLLEAAHVQPLSKQRYARKGSRCIVQS